MSLSRIAAIYVRQMFLLKGNPTRLAKIIPASYVFENMRSILTAGAFPGELVVNLLIGSLLAIVYLLAASRVFIYIYRKNLESGTIARFNAEAL